MWNDKERELKILLTREQYEKILHSYEFEKPIIQTNTYYDTQDDQLKNARGAVRIRQLENGNLLTMKLPADAITKYEFEYPVHTSKMSEISPEEWGRITAHFPLPEPSALKQVAQFTTERRIMRLPFAELCLDQTNFGNQIDYELEYEYTLDHDGISVFNQILKPIGLEFHNNCLSKLARSRAYNSNL